MSSYLWRRGPVVAALGAALALDLDVVWTWATALAVGAALAYAFGRRRAPGWAQRVLPGPRPEGEVRFDMGFWMTEVGGVLRDFDVVAVTLVSAATGGIYALPARLVRPMNLVTNATTAVLFPRIARARGGQPQAARPRQPRRHRARRRGRRRHCSLCRAAPPAGGRGVRRLGAGPPGAVPGRGPRRLRHPARDVLPGEVAGSHAVHRAADAGGRRVQVPAAGVAAYYGDAVSPAWTLSAITAVGCAILLVRALQECGVERTDDSRSRRCSARVTTARPAPPASQRRKRRAARASAAAYRFCPCADVMTRASPGSRMLPSSTMTVGTSERLRVPRSDLKSRPSPPAM